MSITRQAHRLCRRLCARLTGVGVGGGVLCVVRHQQQVLGLERVQQVPVVVVARLLEVHGREQGGARAPAQPRLEPTFGVLRVRVLGQREPERAGHPRGRGHDGRRHCAPKRPSDAAESAGEKKTLGDDRRAKASPASRPPAGPRRDATRCRSDDAALSMVDRSPHRIMNNLATNFRSFPSFSIKHQSQSFKLSYLHNLTLNVYIIFFNFTSNKISDETVLRTFFCNQRTSA